jgi:hypothetical protein
MQPVVASRPGGHKSHRGPDQKLEQVQLHTAGPPGTLNGLVVFPVAEMALLPQSDAGLQLRAHIGYSKKPAAHAAQPAAELKLGLHVVQLAPVQRPLQVQVQPWTTLPVTDWVVAAGHDVVTDEEDCSSIRRSDENSAPPPAAGKLSEHLR